jgi:hypothetical protein
MRPVGPPRNATGKLRIARCSKIAAGLEVGAFGALELALLFIKLCPAVRAGAFDLFQV